jgi:hypothetical protein
VLLKINAKLIIAKIVWRLCIDHFIKGEKQMKIHLIIEQYEDYKRLIESRKKRIFMFAIDGSIDQLKKEVEVLTETERNFDKFMNLDTDFSSF